MNSRSHPSYHLAQLGALLTKPGFELDRKLVVVPAAQTGPEILVSLTAHGYAWVNVTASTLLRFAREVVEEARPDTPYRYVSPAGAALTIDRFLTKSKSKDADVLRRSARSMARTIRDLRLAGVSLRSFDRVVVSRFGRLVSITYRSYLEWLESESLLDDASVLDAATGLFSGAGVLRPPAILAVLDEVTLPDQALRFVESMAKRTGEVWRIGWDATNGQPPVLTAASRLAHWAIPAIESSSEVTDVPGEGGIGISTNREMGILVGTGAENEVRAVFRSVVENEMSLDSVEIAYAANDPYLKIIRSLSSRYDLPVTLAAGVPALDTATGQAIRTFLNWIREGLPGAGLVGMLRGGLVRLSVVDSNGSRDLSELTADILSGVRTGKGKDGYDAALTILHRESVAGAKRAAGTFASDEAVARVQELEDVAEALAPLLELADLPPKLSVSRLVECLRRFILDFAPVNHPPEKNLLSGGGQVSVDPLHDLEQVARQELITRFSQLAEQIGDVVPLVSLIRHAQDLIAIAFVQARAAMPGFMHAVPLSSAGFTGRPNLYVVGLDEQSTGRTVSEDPLLPDEDREELARAGAGRLPISRHLTGRDSWFLTRAISRANGRISLLYSNYSVADDRELYPCSALHRIMSVRNEKIDSLPVHGYDYGGNEYLPLDETDVFLASRSDPRALSVCLDLYPGLKRGDRALAERELAPWSVYDGLLGLESEKLNPFRKNSRVSVSRLETLVRCPFQYFLKYVLGARIPDELDETVWMNALQRGSLVHEGLRRFMEARFEARESIRLSDVERLVSVFEDVLSALVESNPPPNPAEKNALDQELRSVAKAFIYDELSRQERADPVGFEFGFGLWKHRKKREADRTEIVTLNLDGVELRVWGWIDRIDRLRDGGFAITDYKTGSSAGYDEVDLLNKGRALQWALYAYVVEELLGEPVRTSGYLFPGSRELGKRMEADPRAVRSEVATVLRRVGRMARAGMFIQAVEPKGICQWCDYRRVCGNLVERSRCVDAKLEATEPTMAQYELLHGWDFADRKLGGVQ